jgi:hypothetical protein
MERSRLDGNRRADWADWRRWSLPEADPEEERCLCQLLAIFQVFGGWHTN